MTFRPRGIDPRLIAGMLALLTVLCVVDAFRTLGRPGGMLEFTVSSDTIGRLEVYYDRGQGLVNPLWTIRLDAGPDRRVILPLAPGRYTLLGFKPFARGEVRISGITVVSPSTRTAVAGPFAVVHQLQYERRGADGLVLRADAGATDPFGVLPGLDIGVPRPGFSWRHFAWLLSGQLCVALAMAAGWLWLFHIPDRLVRAGGAAPTIGAMQAGALLLAGILVMSARDLNVFLHPLLFAEDGAWISRIYRNGFWGPALSSKDTYFVFGNFAILGIAKVMNDVVMGANIVHLPQFVAIVTNAYYAALALLTVRVLRGTLSPAFLGCAWLIVLMVPFGTASFEMVGRASNMGYSVILLCFLLLLARERLSGPGRITRTAIDLMILACLLTNPLCVPVVLAALFWNLFARWTAPRTASWSPGLWLVLFGAGIPLAWKMLGHRSAQEVVQGQWDGSSLIEVFVARSLLYPIVFPFYERMTDAAVIVAFAACCAVWAWAWSVAKDSRRVLVALLLAAIYSAVCIIVLRQNIVAVLGGYATSGPDRYFMGSVYFAALLTVVSLGILACSRGRVARLAGSAACAALLGLYLGNGNQLVVVGNSPFRFMPEDDFRAALLESWRSGPDEIMRRGFGLVRIPPHMPLIPFPAANIRAAMTGSDGPGR